MSRFVSLLVLLLAAAGIIIGCGHQLTTDQVTGTYQASPQGEVGGMWTVLSADGTWHQWWILDGKREDLNRGTYRIDGDRLKLRTAEGPGVSVGSVEAGVLSVTDPDGQSVQFTKLSSDAAPKVSPSP